MGLSIVLSIKHGKNKATKEYHYDVDFKYNNITGKAEDNTKEIKD